MKRTNLIKKSINLALSVLVAGSIVAVGADGSTMAAVSGNEAIISSVVDAAEVSQIPWSTGYVYQLLPIDLSTGGQGSAPDGSMVSMDYIAGANQDWRASFTTAITADGQTLQFQHLEPRNPDLFTLCGQMTGGYYFTDATKLKELDVMKQKMDLHTHLWEFTQSDFVTELTMAGASNVAATYYDAVDEGLYYRITCNFNNMCPDGVTPANCLITFVEVKATGEIYSFNYTEPTTTYNDILAKEIIYSCVPTKLQ